MTWCLGLDLISLQGTKVIEDHEIRHSFHVTAEGSPPLSGYADISKYTGDLSAPEWEDVEPGRVSGFPWHLVKSAHSPKDRFETLCHVEVDISNLPYTSHSLKKGKMGYRRNYEIILLVGLTELKAQVSWIDKKTVRAHIILHMHLPHMISTCVNLGERGKVCSNVLRVSPPRAESRF